MEAPIAVIPWYTSPECYAQFRAAALDGAYFFETYRQWQAACLEHELRAAEAGVMIVRSRMDFQEFEAWRRSENRQHDDSSRSEFAVFRLRKVLGD
jgi:hypothetical protein